MKIKLLGIVAFLICSCRVFAVEQNGNSGRFADGVVFDVSIKSSQGRQYLAVCLKNISRDDIQNFSREGYSVGVEIQSPKNIGPDAGNEIYLDVLLPSGNPRQVGELFRKGDTLCLFFEMMASNATTDGEAGVRSGLVLPRNGTFLFAIVLKKKRLSAELAKVKVLVSSATSMRLTLIEYATPNAMSL